MCFFVIFFCFSGRFRPLTAFKPFCALCFAALCPDASKRESGKQKDPFRDLFAIRCDQKSQFIGVRKYGMTSRIFSTPVR